MINSGFAELKEEEMLTILLEEKVLPSSDPLECEKCAKRILAQLSSSEAATSASCQGETCMNRSSGSHETNVQRVVTLLRIKKFPCKVHINETSANSPRSWFFCSGIWKLMHWLIASRRTLSRKRVAFASRFTQLRRSIPHIRSLANDHKMVKELRIRYLVCNVLLWPMPIKE